MTQLPSAARFVSSVIHVSRAPAATCPPNPARLGVATQRSAGGAAGTLNLLQRELLVRVGAQLGA
jgi:hypothetical protein